jgi:hypothetical protein
MEESSEVPVAPALVTSRLAVIAGLMALFCPLVGGAFGVPLGILALLQIRANPRLAGAGMAWLGVVAGILQLGGAAALWNRVQQELALAEPAVAGFLDATCKQKFEGAPVATGLRPLMERGVASDSGQRLVDALGPFEKLGARGAYRVQWKEGAPQMEVEYELRFAKGAPAIGKFTLVKEYGATRVMGFSVRSVALKPPVEAMGVAAQELGNWAGKSEPKGLKEYGGK